MTTHHVKAAVRLRDGLRCVDCGMSQAAHLAEYGRELDVHRITPGSAYSTAPGVCETLCRRCHGPKRKRRPGHMPGDAAVTSKVDRALHRRLKMLAAGAEQDLTEYLDALLRQHVETEWPRFLRDQA